MEKKYNEFKMVRTEGLSSRYGFSASDKKIRVNAELYDLDNDIIFEEAVLVRDLYCKGVKDCKDRGEKPKPQAIKTQSYLEAERQLQAKYGQQYTSLFSDKVVKEYTPNKVTSIKEEKKEVNQKVVTEVNQGFEEDLDALMSEFDSNVTEPVVKIKPIDLSNLDITPTTDEYKPKKEMVEDVSMDEVASDDLSVFDVELDIDDLFDL